MDCDLRLLHSKLQIADLQLANLSSFHFLRTCDDVQTRTSLKTTQTSDVLDGFLDIWIFGYLDFELWKDNDELELGPLELLPLRHKSKAFSN